MELFLLKTICKPSCFYVGDRLWISVPKNGGFMKGKHLHNGVLNRALPGTYKKRIQPWMYSLYCQNVLSSPCELL